MPLRENHSARHIWLAGVLGGLVSGLVIAGVMLLVFHESKDQTKRSDPLLQISQTPLLDHLDKMRCARGLKRVVQIGGQEDSFARTGTEPARIERSLLRFGSFADLQAGKARALGLRSYDEGGTDKQLVDHFNVPKGAVNGALLLKLRAAGNGSDNDYLRLLPSVTTRSGSGTEALSSFSLSISAAVEQSVQAKSGDIISIPLENFADLSPVGGPEEIAKVLAYTAALPEGQSPLSLIVSDDTAVDVAALFLCVEPEEVQGVTFSELSAKSSEPALSVLACAVDETQSHCGPYSGDTLCTTQLPVACYKDGSSLKPDNLSKAGLNDAAFVGGEVRPSISVAASQFRTRGAADAFCVSQFGIGWRVLSYQEGGGGVVISRSTIAPRTRLWIDIADQPRGRCWDRPAFGSVPPKPQ